MRILSEEEKTNIKTIGLTNQQFITLNEILSNFCECSDEDLEDIFIQENIPRIIIVEALQLKPQFLVDPLCELAITDGGLRTQNIRQRLDAYKKEDKKR